MRQCVASAIPWLIFFRQALKAYWPIFHHSFNLGPSTPQLRFFQPSTTFSIAWYIAGDSSSRLFLQQAMLGSQQRLSCVARKNMAGLGSIRSDMIGPHHPDVCLELVIRCLNQHGFNRLTNIKHLWMHSTSELGAHTPVHSYTAASRAAGCVLSAHRCSPAYAYDGAEDVMIVNERCRTSVTDWQPLNCLPTIHSSGSHGFRTFRRNRGWSNNLQNMTVSSCPTSPEDPSYWYLGYARHFLGGLF